MDHPNGLVQPDGSAVHGFGGSGPETGGPVIERRTTVGGSRLECLEFGHVCCFLSQTQPWTPWTRILWRSLGSQIEVLRDQSGCLERQSTTGPTG